MTKRRNDFISDMTCGKCAAGLVLVSQRQKPEKEGDNFNNKSFAVLDCPRPSCKQRWLVSTVMQPIASPIHELTKEPMK